MASYWLVWYLWGELWPVDSAPAGSLTPVSVSVSEEVVSSMVDAVLAGGRTEAGLVNVIHVLLPLLDCSAAGAGGGGGVGVGLGGLLGAAEEASVAAEPTSVAVTVSALLPRLAALHQSLVCPPPRPDLTTSWGRLSPPLGATRLQLARLTAALLATNRPAVHARLAELGTVDVLLVRPGDRRGQTGETGRQTGETGRQTGPAW